MARVRRVDHIAIRISDTDRAVREIGERLGLTAVHTETLSDPAVRLTYLDAGNVFIQLVEPLDPESDMARELRENGEGVHHVCFAVDDVAEAIAEGHEVDGSAVVGTGRGRVSAFPPNANCCGMRFEFTEFRFAEDVDQTRGWIPDPGIEGASRALP
jgi:methylmalonyl-CoA epimerase